MSKNRKRVYADRTERQKAYDRYLESDHWREFKAAKRKVWAIMHLTTPPIFERKQPSMSSQKISALLTEPLLTRVGGEAN